MSNATADDNSLESLRKITNIVSDSGEFNIVKKYKPVDTTTNPSLLLVAAQNPAYKHLITEAVRFGKSKSSDPKEQISWAADKLAVEFGTELLKICPGRVSTELDARLSFDTKACLEKALRIIALYKEAGIDKNRVLIKIASTWEGIQTAKILERDHQIHCNLTLLFGFPQAVACANAGVTIISPFVGRIMDWYKAKYGKDYTKEPATDPGVISVTRIFNFYKQHKIKTSVMGASFRNIGEVLELAGVDYLTISPTLLEELTNKKDPVPRKLNMETAKSSEPYHEITEEEFRQAMASEAEKMAAEKLEDGIKRFSEDTDKLEDMLRNWKE